MNYRAADQKLQGRNRAGRKLANNTYLERRDGDTIAVRLHETDVVTFRPNGDTVLNSGGWRTLTTKDRINEFGMPTGQVLLQTKGVWHLAKGWNDPEPIPYADGITITKRGTVKHEGKATPAADKRIKARVKAFSQLCADSLPLDRPGPGDCFICMASKNGTRTDTGHLDAHMGEGYVVPRLVYNALTEAGSAPATFWGAFKRDDPTNAQERISSNLQGFANERVQKSVYRYILKRYGFAA